MARFRYFTCYWSVEASAQMVFSQPLSRWCFCAVEYGFPMQAKDGYYVTIPIYQAIYLAICSVSLYNILVMKQP